MLGLKLNQVSKRGYRSNVSIQMVGNSARTHVVSPHGLQHIFFSLVDFNVEFQEDCVFDSLRILTPVSMRYCGILSGEAILIPSNIVTAVFTSDSSVASTGFHIEYQALEPGTTPREYDTPEFPWWFMLNWINCLSKSTDSKGTGIDPSFINRFSFVILVVLHICELNLIMRMFNNCLHYFVRLYHTICCPGRAVWSLAGMLFRKKVWISSIML